MTNFNVCKVESKWNHLILLQRRCNEL